MKGKRGLFLTFLALVVILGLTAPVQGQGRRFKSPGEQIYYTGIASNGRDIFRYGGPMWIRMHGGGCVSCHGIHGRGGVPVMEGMVIPTDIRYKTLTGKEKRTSMGGRKKSITTRLL